MAAPAPVLSFVDAPAPAKRDPLLPFEAAQLRRLINAYDAEGPRIQREFKTWLRQQRGR
jgi:hypothetical protein